MMYINARGREHARTFPFPFQHSKNFFHWDLQFMGVKGEMCKIPSPSFSVVLIFGFLLLNRAPQQCQGMSAEPAV